MGSLNGIIETLIALGIIIGLSVWGLFTLYSHYFVDHDIKVKQPLIPKIELIIENNKVDTIYIYKIK